MRNVNECLVNSGDCDPLTTCTNTPGAFTCSACPPGYTGDGATGCVAEVCTGDPGTQCPCVKVNPSGDDALGTTSHGLSPFASVQAAIDFAAAYPEVATNVCVAAGAACGASHSYPGPTGADLTMRDGIGVYGAYESTTWGRCALSTTTLSPTTATGVLFGSGITQATTLDGFTIELLDAATTTGVTVNGASGVTLNDLVVTDVNLVQSASRFGVDVLNGGDATLTQCDVRLLSLEGWNAVGVRSAQSRVTVSQSSVAEYIEIGPVVGIELSDSPGSLIEGSSITVTRDTDTDGEYSAVGAQIGGDADGVSVEGMTITLNAGDSSTGIELYGTGSVALSNNAIKVTGYGGYLDGIGASGGQLAIENNQVLINVVGAGTTAQVDETGISCSGSCTILDNDVQIEHSNNTIGNAGTSMGIYCQGCDEVSGNSAGLLGGNYPYTIGGPRSTYYNAIGMSLGAALIDRNSIDLGWADTGVGLITSGSRVQNNFISGRSAPTSAPGNPNPIDLPSKSYGLQAGPNTDIHSNTISSGVCTGDNAAIRLSGSGSTVRNNILTGCAYNLLEQNASSDPAALENNDFVGPSYEDEGTTLLSSVAAINALSGAASNFSGVCSTQAPWPCLNTGTTTQAPSYDFNGKARDSMPERRRGGVERPLCRADVRRARDVRTAGCLHLRRRVHPGPE